MYIIAGIVAAASVWVIRGLSFRIMGPRANIYFIPLEEEVFKTYWALFFGTSIFLTHAFFGLIEGINAFISWRSLGFMNGVNILLGNLLFGYITSEFYDLYQQKVIAIGGAYLFHIIWKLFITKLTIEE